ncbi:YbaB/EbfC family nucleoid-associated protein [Rhizomonospora bruguierae]|uniref:YbaB/EbfC family nucleoid-associated protein n=1 Tax=Rhizomonospora bruguierae TaxID=1581705 RepID=UPI001BCFFFA9|nr:YbaB/EbfC family nucleoid-associated protein [Micromonospora sp. NBRC 107566]
MQDDLERMREAEAARRAGRQRVDRLFAEMAGRHHTGAAADGTVTARIDGCGMVLAVDIQPDGMSLSPQDLSARVLEALREAQEVAQRGQRDFLARRWTTGRRG